MIKCSECGYENIDGLDYCDGCGAKLTHGAASAGESAAAAAPTAEAAAQPAPAEAAPEAAAAEPPPSEVPTGEIKPPAEASAAAAAAPAAPPAEAAAAPAARARLQVMRGGRKGHEFPLEDGNNLIGRWDPET